MANANLEYEPTSMKPNDPYIHTSIGISTIYLFARIDTTDESTARPTLHTRGVFLSTRPLIHPSIHLSDPSSLPTAGKKDNTQDVEIVAVVVLVVVVVVIVLVMTVTASTKHRDTHPSSSLLVVP